MDKQMWVEKYRPTTVAEVIGNEAAKAAFIDWLKNRRTHKAVLLYGPAGIGKTALVHAAAHDFNYQLIEMNASDTRTRKAIMKIAGPAVSLVSLDEFFRNLKGNLLLLDEVDGVFGREDRGGVKAIIKIIKESQIPIVLTANNPDIQKLRPLTKVSHWIKFRRIRMPVLVALLRKICRTEELSAEPEALEAIATRSQGDVRSAINDLQTLCEGTRTLRAEAVQQLLTRNRPLDIYQTLTGVFSAASPQESRRILNNSTANHDTLLLAIHDNLPLRYRDVIKLATAYDTLSRADIFRGRIGVEVWRLLPYVYDLLAQSATIAPPTFQPFNPIFPPRKFVLLKWTARERAILKNICTHIAVKCHVSKRLANLQFIPFLRAIFKKQTHQTSNIAKWLELDAKSLEYLRRTA